MTKLKSFIECSICSDRFGLTDDNDETVTPCGHVYHGLCLAKWLESSVSTTCPECRSPVSMLQCRRVYFRYSNDSDSAQSYIDYLSKDLAKKTMELQNERSAKKKLEQDYGGQLKERDYAIAKLKYKLREKKQRRQQESEMTSSAIIQNNSIFHNLINMNQGGVFPPCQSSNTGTVAAMNSPYMTSSGMHYPNCPNKQFNMNPAFMPNNAGVQNVNQMLQMHNHHAQHWQQSNMENMLNANAMPGPSSNLSNLPASSVQHSVSNMISNQMTTSPPVNVFASNGPNNMRVQSPRMSQLPPMYVPVSPVYLPFREDVDEPVRDRPPSPPPPLTYSTATSISSNTINSSEMQSRSSVAPPPIIDFIDLLDDLPEAPANARASNGPPSLPSTSGRSNTTNNAANSQQQESTSSGDNSLVQQIYDQLSPYAY